MSGCCSACGEECGDLISLGFTQVCRYCFRETCLEEPLLEDFGPDFLERQGADFFLSWWWGGDAYLTEEEKLEAVKSIFAKREKRFPEEARTARREYIREVFPEWEDYLCGR